MARVERDLAAGRDPFPHGVVVPIPGGPVGALLLQWTASLKKRNARDDRSWVTRHPVPEFEKLRVDELTLPVVMTWVERLAESELSPRSQRHLLGLLSRRHEHLRAIGPTGEAILISEDAAGDDHEPVLESWNDGELKASAHLSATPMAVMAGKSIINLISCSEGRVFVRRYDSRLRGVGVTAVDVACSMSSKIAADGTMLMLTRAPGAAGAAAESVELVAVDARPDTM